MNLEELQTLVDFIALSLGEKAKYKAVINPRLRRSYAKALHSKFLETGRRIIHFSKSYINSTSSKRITETIIHEITHFKLAERNRKKVHKSNFRASTKIGEYNRLFPYYLIKREKHHNKRFYKRFEKLQTKFNNQINQLDNEYQPIIK